MDSHPGINIKYLVDAKTTTLYAERLMRSADWEPDVQASVDICSAACSSNEALSEVLPSQPLTGLLCVAAGHVMGLSRANMYTYQSLSTK